MTFSELKDNLQGCQNRAAIRELVVPYLDDVFHGLKRGLFFFDEMELTEADRVKFLDNPVVKKFMKTEVGLHESLVVENSVWRQHCPRADHGHVLVGPLVCKGAMVGMVAVTRDEEGGVFDEASLAAMNRLCLYVSSRLAELPGNEVLEALTGREREIAELAARGLSNLKIAEELVVSEHTVKQHLKAVFRKLEIGSRAELGWVLRGS